MQQEPHGQGDLLHALDNPVQLLGHYGADGRRATAYMYRDCIAEKAVEGGKMPLADAGPWMGVGAVMGAG